MSAKKTNRPLKIVFPGKVLDEDYLNECRKSASESQLEVNFTGTVSREELNKLINQSKLHVLNSRNEGRARSLVETAAADVPSLITNRIGAGKNYITEKTGGICFQWNLAKNIKLALDTWNKPVREGFMEASSINLACKNTVNAFKDKGWV